MPVVGADVQRWPNTMTESCEWGPGLAPQPVASPGLGGSSRAEFGGTRERLDPSVQRQPFAVDGFVDERGENCLRL